MIRFSALFLFLVSALLLLFALFTPINPLLFIISSIIMFMIMFFLANTWPLTKSILPVVVCALIIRVIFLFLFPASDDVNRYVWEGKIQNYGFNPFITPPNSPLTINLQDNVWQKINFKELPTIYWPFAQILFKITAKLSPTIFGFKLLILLFDCAAMFLLFKFCSVRGISKRYGILYALNPLVLIYLSGEGHVEAIILFCIVLALLSFEWPAKKNSGFSALALAILTKLNCAILVPFFMQKMRKRSILFFLTPFILCIPYLISWQSFISIPSLFLTSFAYNGALYFLLTHVLELTKPTTMIILFMIFAIGMLYIFIFTPSLLKASFSALGLMLLVLPTVHPWYFLLMTPFVVLFRSYSWLCLQCTSLLLFFFYNSSVTHAFFHNYSTLLLFEYIPFCIVFFIETFYLQKKWPVMFKECTTLCVLIPTRNESKNINTCIQSITSQNANASIIVIDAESTDDTISIALSHKDVTVLHSKKGRGVQMACGVAATKADAILIVHADCQLTQGSLIRIIQHLNQNPACAGGSFRSHYNTQSFKLAIVLLFNTIRCKFMGISFGDQGQFFRKEALGNNFPDYYLMEDIELSLRLKEKGTLAFLPSGIIASSRRWQVKGYVKNILTVIWLFWLFMLLRSVSLVKDKGLWFFNTYYRK